MKTMYLDNPAISQNNPMLPSEKDELPLTIEQIKARQTDDGYITAVVELSIDDLFDGIEFFNDKVSELITGSECGLTDISYQAVGAVNGSVLVEVTASVDEIIQEEDDFIQEEDEGMVFCSICGQLCLQQNAHIHQGDLIGDECCWDEHLKSCLVKSLLVKDYSGRKISWQTMKDGVQ
jgi:hypothetical protein